MQVFPLTIAPKDEDEKWMLEALKEAWKSLLDDEVPVGAVLVSGGRVVSRGRNQVEQLCDATAHAEMLCLTSGEAALERWRLNDATLYCTMEPCSMCAGAMFLTRLHTVVWGAPDLRHGANGSWVDLFKPKHQIHEVKVKSGILAAEAAWLLREFFQKQRQRGKRNASEERIDLDRN